MKAKAAFVVGVGIGYVFGTAAGRQKFEKMKQKANEVWHSDQVQDTVGDLQDKATDFAKTQGGALADKVGEGVGKASETVKSKFSSDDSDGGAGSDAGGYAGGAGTTATTQQPGGAGAPDSPYGEGDVTPPPRI